MSLPNSNLPSTTQTFSLFQSVQDLPRKLVQLVKDEYQSCLDWSQRNRQYRWELINRSVRNIDPDSEGGQKFTRATLDWKPMSISASEAEASSDTLRIRASGFGLSYTDVPSRVDRSIEQPENTRRVTIVYASSAPGPGSANIDRILYYNPPEPNGVVKPMVVRPVTPSVSTQGTKDN
ncbi:hypothetical protein I302_104085 [Kwoniella bestiolae CBS 10118]|uniref:Uncharacterized protein n=1 Tax=Kwoniella bestiolae CBS 10118 TaxID=1296100 RepID=A0A1B9GA98_9TREE|nr:hypothetical protein I302_02790 [Kwoniella bestiolae CBS 10118]OCF27940.1 hypothetical protein I302_02790 [Kwoniella bestiolae CBS 10118]